jgi:integrase
MAVKSYLNENAEELWMAYVNVRSKTNPAIRVQRKVSAIKTRNSAEKEETTLIRECEREIAARECQGQTWGAVIEAWERYLTGKGTHTQSFTLRDYVSALRNHTGQWWKRPAAEISRVDVREVLDTLRANGASVSYQNKVKVIINRPFVFGMEHGLIRGLDKSPAFGISLGRQEQKKPEILTIQEIRKLLEAARNLSHPWYPIWATALLTGMRNGELYALLWSDIDWETQAISVTKSYNARIKRVKSTKSGDWRTVPVSSELLTLLRELRSQAGARTEVLPRCTGRAKGEQARELRKFCVGLGLPSIRFHTLRACFATQLIRSGVPPIQIQKVCGWKDLETMQRYIRLAGIETNGVTEHLRVLPEANVMARVVNLFTHRPEQPETQK